jgi:hypothetical protein
VWSCADFVSEGEDVRDANRGFLNTCWDPPSELTFVVTNVEGMTSLCEWSIEAMTQALILHDMLLRQLLERCGNNSMC